MDDDEEIIDLLRFNLERAGFEVCPATNGADALKLAQENPPDLVLLDLMMPGLNGFTVCETLRRDEGTARVPVVMLTAMPGQFCKLFGYEVGVSEFLEKPFSVQTLVGKIRSLVETSSLPECNKPVTTLFPTLNCVMVGDMLSNKREAKDIGG